MADPAVLEALEELLREERAALLAGELGGIADLAERKERLVRSLARAPEGQPALQRVERTLRRNAALLAAAAEGLRQAVARLQALRAGPGPLATYDGRGQRLDLSPPEPSLSRRS